MRFIGVDLAWSPRNPSGGAILSDTGELLTSTGLLGDDDAILEFITTAIPSNAQGLVAIDAPLAVPNESGGRPCDRQVAAIFGRFEAAPYPANRQNLATYGGLRAETIRERLQLLGFRHDPSIIMQGRTRQVIEVFPHPATVSLFHLDRTLKYKARSKRDYTLRWHELTRLRDNLLSLANAIPPLRLPSSMATMRIEGLRGKSLKEAEDLLDALVCAYSALYAWYHGPQGYGVYGNADEGHILVPMTPEMWTRIKGQRLLLLNRDGTLGRSPGRHSSDHPDEVELLPGVAAKVHMYAALGWRIVIVTNQGGIVSAKLPEAQADKIQQSVLDLLPVSVDASYLCSDYSDGTMMCHSSPCPNQKPGRGVILEALARFGAQAEDCLCVSNQESDRLAAAAAHVPFQWAWEFFGWARALPS
ncbi:MAG TPA: DUF429 domain-containing protein [Anaerolineae bacterium]|nr:DUF429 domain-containing protein [Anaerolineae bacterium]